MRRHQPGFRCAGQALAEGVVGLLALVVLFWAVPWVGRYLDIALATAHVSHHAAMQRTRTLVDEDVPGMPLPPAMAAPYARAAWHWRGPDGQAVLQAESLQREHHPVAAETEPGQDRAAALRLRQDWGAESGLHLARVQARTRDPLPGGASLQVQRASAVMAGAGHARSDLEMQQRIAAGRHGWSSAAQASYAAGARVKDAVAAADAAWPREAPVLDWLLPWTGLAPSARLRAGP